MNLGSRLKNTLEERGMTVTQFAKKAGVPAQTVYALINRDSNKADMDILMKLLTALNMDFFTFMSADAPDECDVTSPKAASECAGASTEPSASPDAAKEQPVEKMVEEEAREEAAAREVPAEIPEGKVMLLIDAAIYERALELAKEEGIGDESVLAQVFDVYLELGFGYRQRPLKSIMRDYAPKTERSGDMDSFLL